MTEQEAGRNQLPMTLVAIGPASDALGAVALSRSDDGLSDSVRRQRSPWLVGLVVRSDVRRQGIGTLLVRALERLAAAHGYSRVWVATGGEAVEFYRACGWAEEESLILAGAGLRATVLTKRIAT